MPVFASAHRLAATQQTYFTRAQRRENKRRRLEEPDADGNDEEEEDASSKPLFRESSPTRETQADRPVNRTDPYHVAGLSRAADLPPSPFPHGPIKGPGVKDLPLIEEELARLNPPIFAPRGTIVQNAASLRRRHAEHLTTILHSRMLEGDWTRAFRAFALLLRTEISGHGPDLRHHGRWAIGAELLMMSGSVSHDRDAHKHESTTGRGDHEADDARESESTCNISAKGFRLAREYYDRLILQYPYTQWRQTGFNALAIYPALFSTWVYQVQAEAKQARRRRLKNAASTSPQARRASAGSQDGGEDASMNTTIAGYRLDEEEDDDDDGNDDRIRIDITRDEFQGANAIAQRLDELLISPPFDNSVPLLRLRGFVGLWISDLSLALLGSLGGREENPRRRDVDADQMLKRAREEKEKSIAILSKLQSTGHDIDISLDDLEADEDRMSE